MKKIISLEVTKVAEGHLETVMSIHGSPEEVLIGVVEAPIKINDCVNGSDIFKVKNGFWLLIQDIVNKELAERATK